MIKIYCHKCRKETSHHYEQKERKNHCSICDSINNSGVRLGTQYQSVFDKLKRDFQKQKTS